tara:strand:+ start:12607 stop:14217 length:1611 start_codon:yes stop_codon:yes gene_type:complete
MGKFKLKSNIHSGFKMMGSSPQGVAPQGITPYAKTPLYKPEDEKEVVETNDPPKTTETTNDNETSLMREARESKEQQDIELQKFRDQQEINNAPKQPTEIVDDPDREDGGVETGFGGNASYNQQGDLVSNDDYVEDPTTVKSNDDLTYEEEDSKRGKGINYNFRDDTDDVHVDYGGQSGGGSTSASETWTEDASGNPVKVNNATKEAINQVNENPNVTATANTADPNNLREDNEGSNTKIDQLNTNQVDQDGNPVADYMTVESTSESIQEREQDQKGGTYRSKYGKPFAPGDSIITGNNQVEGEEYDKFGKRTGELEYGDMNEQYGQDKSINEGITEADLNAINAERQLGQYEDGSLEGNLAGDITGYDDGLDSLRENITGRTRASGDIIGGENVNDKIRFIQGDNITKKVLYDEDQGRMINKDKDDAFNRGGLRINPDTGETEYTKNNVRSKQHVINPETGKKELKKFINGREVTPEYKKEIRDAKKLYKQNLKLDKKNKKQNKRDKKKHEFRNPKMITNSSGKWIMNPNYNPNQ